jgi:hypothetical protein
MAKSSSEEDNRTSRQSKEAKKEQSTGSEPVAACARAQIGNENLNGAVPFRQTKPVFETAEAGSWSDWIRVEFTWIRGLLRECVGK